MTTSPWPRRRLVTLVLLTAGGTLAFDQATKAVARRTLRVCSLPRCPRVHAFGPFGFLREANAGSALGYGQGLWIWTGVAVLGLLLVAAVLRWGRSTGALAFGAGLLLGGGVGNLLDRLILGRVTDFLDVSLPGGGGITVNLADAAMIVGAVVTSAALYGGLFRAPAGGSPPGSVDPP